MSVKVFTQTICEMKILKSHPWKQFLMQILTINTHNWKKNTSSFDMEKHMSCTSFICCTVCWVFIWTITLHFLNQRNQRTRMQFNESGFQKNYRIHRLWFFLKKLLLYDEAKCRMRSITFAVSLIRLHSQLNHCNTRWLANQFERSACLRLIEMPTAIDIVHSIHQQVVHIGRAIKLYSFIILYCCIGQFDR